MSDSGTDGLHAHATALVVRETGVLVRGASGAGKSRLALLLIAEAERQGMFARMVGDDRVHLSSSDTRLVARSHPRVCGLAERRGDGIIAVPHEPACVVRVVIDLLPGDLPRWPDDDQHCVTIRAVALPRFVVRAGLADVGAAEVLARVFDTTR